MKFCLRCGLRVDGGMNKYCSEDCRKNARLTREVNAKRYKENRETVSTAWEGRHPGLSIYPGWPHKFNEELVCEYCDVEWRETRNAEGVRCTNPEGHSKIRINSDGRPKVIRGM